MIVKGKMGRCQDKRLRWGCGGRQGPAFVGASRILLGRSVSISEAKEALDLFEERSTGIRHRCEET
jgi:hypothetical protein